MKWLIEKFKRWRAWPYKDALAQAHREHVITAKVFHELMARFDKL